MQLVPQIGYYIFHFCHLHTAFNLFSDHLLLLLQNVVVERSCVFQFTLLLIQHTFIFLLHLLGGQVLNFQLAVPLLAFLQFPLKPLNVPADIGSLVLQPVDAHFLFIGSLLLLDEDGVDIHHFHLHLVQTLLSVLCLVVLKLEFVLELSLLLYHLVEFGLVIFVDPVQLHFQSLQRKFQLVFRGFQLSTLCLVVLQLQLQLLYVHATLRLCLSFLALQNIKPFLKLVNKVVFLINLPFEILLGS